MLGFCFLSTLKVLGLHVQFQLGLSDSFLMVRAGIKAFGGRPTVVRDTFFLSHQGYVLSAGLIAVDMAVVIIKDLLGLSPVVTPFQIVLSGKGTSPEALVMCNVLESVGK